VRALLAGAVGIAGDPGVVTPVLTELIEQIGGEVALGSDGGGDPGGIGRGHVIVAFG
jgi:hypothetical protein